MTELRERERERERVVEDDGVVSVEAGTSYWADGRIENWNRQATGSGGRIV